VTVKRCECGAEKPNWLRRGARIATPDGNGVIIGSEMRKNTNGGPGARQYRVRLADGRIRHYTPTEVMKVTP
jgi:hypothetical protein